jgi:hypothetical protein
MTAYAKLTDSIFSLVVSRPFPSWNRVILTEIYLCHSCSCQEILRTETAGQACSYSEELEDARRLLLRVKRRQLYKFIGESVVRPNVQAPTDQVIN